MRSGTSVLLTIAVAALVSCGGEPRKPAEERPASGSPEEIVVSIQHAPFDGTNKHPVHHSDLGNVVEPEAAPDPSAPTLEEVERLIEEIKTAVEPVYWKTDATAAIHAQGKWLLVVRAKRSVQSEVELFLEGYAAARGAEHKR